MDGGVKGEPNTALILQVLSQTREETPRPAERIDKGLYEREYFSPHAVEPPAASTIMWL